MEKRFRFALFLLNIFISTLIISYLVYKPKEVKVIKEYHQPKEEHKLEVAEIVIKDFILESNPSIKEGYAEKLAQKIVKESELRGNSPYIQAALLASESSFYSGPKHDIKTVYGMGGIYVNVWSKTLKKEGIIWRDNDLLNPYTNIEASSYVLSVYMNMSKSPREAISRYKGYCTLGKKQANKVMEVAIALKQESKELEKINA